MELDLRDVQQYGPIPQSYEGMLPSKPSSSIGINSFGDIQTSHKSLDIGFRGQTPRFHTPRSIQGLEVELNEYRKGINMFQQVAKYNTQMTSILFKFFSKN